MISGFGDKERKHTRSSEGSSSIFEKRRGRHFCTEPFHQCVPVLSTRLSFNKKIVEIIRIVVIVIIMEASASFFSQYLLIVYLLRDYFSPQIVTVS